MAEPRFLDPSIDPNDRQPGASFIGPPETANPGPVGIARFSTLRAWLSQWSIDHTNAHGERSAAQVSVPQLVIKNTGDDAVPAPHTHKIFDAARSKDKTYEAIKGATHCYAGQPELLQRTVDLCTGWMKQRKLLDRWKSPSSAPASAG